MSPTLSRSLRASGATTSNSQTAPSFAVPLPSPGAPVAGNLLIINILQRGGAASLPVQPNTPSGWSRAQSQTATTSNQSLRLTTFYKVASGTESGSVTVTTSGTGNTASWAATYEEFAGVLSSSPFDQVGEVASFTSGSGSAYGPVFPWGSVTSSEDYTTEFASSTAWVYSPLAIRYSTNPANPDVTNGDVYFGVENDNAKNATKALTVFSDVVTGTANVLVTAGVALDEAFMLGSGEVGFVQSDEGGQVTSSTSYYLSVGYALVFRGAGADAAFVFDGLTASVDASSSSDVDGIATFEWVWGDGSVSPASNSPKTSHTYAAAGTYNITLTITDAKGNKTTETRSFVASSNAS